MKRYKMLLDKFENEGFTLIELLAVIVILAIIALIATPIILNIIEKARKSAFQDTAYGLIETARLEYTEGILDGDYIAKTYEAPFEELKFSGSKPKGGTIAVGNDGKVAIAIHNNRWCAIKEYEETVVRLLKYEEETCKIDGTLPIIPEKEMSFEEKMQDQAEEIMTNDPDNNLRYVGSNPNNYIKFNNELWRIIGIFDGQAKIIRSEKYSKPMALNSANTSNWNNSSLQAELNGVYLDSIDEKSRSYIDETHVWKLGRIATNYNGTKRNEFYTQERGDITYAGNPSSWTGAIGIIYISDYGYSTSSKESFCDDVMYSWKGNQYTDCISNSWMYHNGFSQWTLDSPLYDTTAFVVEGIGSTTTYYVTDTTDVYPVLYLKQEVKIKSGVGSQEKPFILVES